MRLCVLLLYLILVGSAYASAGEVDVILVRSDLPQEFAVAQAYSHLSGVPIVTTPSQELSDEAREQLRGYIQLGYRNLVIIGGEKAVSLEVQREIDALGYVTRRIAEADRYGTAATFAKEFYSRAEGAILLYGESSENLLLAMRLSYATGYPILFVRRDHVPPAVKDALASLRVKKVLLFPGGLEASVKEELSGYRVVPVERGFAPPAKRSTALPVATAFAAGLVLGVLGAIAYRRVRKMKQRLPYEVLSEDEERVVRAITGEGGRLTQDALPEKTGFSRPKISRIVKELVERGIIEKVPKGRTHELIIKKEFYR
ncbi:MAG: MarR family transcriptional regulator [Euryarchaeota archaeon]|nr:MarR family transcriptional regulator [Euryarchaeota archaeon]